MATSLELAITAIRSNRKDEGRQLLNLLIQENPNNEMAWLWMSSVVDTDEQRARCLYHVLAVNPDNQIARRGLQLLGIVVSDSRPVKVPRDSQPIKIPKPIPPNTQFVPTDTQPFKPQPTPEPQPAPAEERRPFRIDPQTIVDELPFKPITKPFTSTPQPSAQPTDQAAQTAEKPSEPGPMVQTSETGPAKISAPPQPITPETPPAGPSQPVPVIQSAPSMPGNGETGSWPNSWEPGPVGATNTAPAANVPVQQPPGTGPWQYAAPPVQTGTGPMQAAVQPPAINAQPMQPGAQYYPPQAAPAPQQFPAGTGPPQDTRPSQPVTPVQPPSQPVPVVHSNITMGMPTQYVQAQAQGYSQPVAPVHSNTTMGMPAYEQQPQQPGVQNYAVHSNSTMMMPAGATPFPTPTSPNPQDMVDYRVANVVGANMVGAPNNSQINQALEKNDDEEEEINVLAVVVFGSLSVTALGGLGMLILLMFAT